MGLTIRFSHEENVVRSTGDDPTGIVGLHLNDEELGTTWYVDGEWQPAPGRQAGPEIEPVRELRGVSVSVEAVVDGCVDDVALVAVYAAASNAVTAASQSLVEVGDLDTLRSLLQLQHDTCCRVVDRLEGGA